MKKRKDVLNLVAYCRGGSGARGPYDFPLSTNMINHQKDVEKSSEDKDGVTEGDYDAGDPEDEEGTAANGIHDDEKRKKGSSQGIRKNGSREATLPGCQVDMCGADLRDGKKYHRRHKVCEVHAKATTVIRAGIRQRFCQQCSRFHEVGEFDKSKRSCRRRLVGHNERRRKSGTDDYYGENSSRSSTAATQTKERQHWQPDERGRGPIVIPGNQAH